MFNPGDETIDSAHQLIKFPIHVGALVLVTSSLDTHSLKSEGDPPPFPDPNMVLSLSTSSYQVVEKVECNIASVLTKANRAVQSIVQLECNSCKANLY
jgi:hypothetical protein